MTDEKLKTIESRFKEIGPYFRFSYGDGLYIFKVTDGDCINDTNKQGVIMMINRDLQLNSIFDIIIEQIDKEDVFEDIKNWYEKGISKEDLLRFAQ